MKDIRERTETIKIKGGVKKGPDISRQMTLKLGRELVKQRRRDSGGSTDTTPEAQAAEQAEGHAFAVVEGIRGFRSSVSKSIVRYERKQQRIKERKKAPASEAPPTENTEQIRPDTITEEPAQAVTHRKQPETPPRPFKERARQEAIKDKRSQRMEIRQRTDTPKERPAPTPMHEKAVIAEALPKPPTPRERMKQKAVSELRARRIKDRYIPDAPSSEPTELPIYSNDIKTVYPDSKSKTAPTIKERPRRSFSVKDKSASCTPAPKTRKSAPAVKLTAKGPQAIPLPREQARRRVLRNAQRKLLRQSMNRTRTAAGFSRKAVAAVGKAISSGISAIAGLLSSTVLVAVICVLVVIGGIMASPFGILFSNEPSPNAVPLNVAIGRLNMELSDMLEDLQDGDYDGIDVQGQGPDWREVVAVFAVKTAGADDGVDVAALTPDRFERLRAVFWDMCIVDSWVESIDHPDSDPDDGIDDSWTEYILHITVTAKTAEDMRAEYDFTEQQNEALTELLDELAAMELLITDLTSCDERARELLDNLPDDLDPERRAVVETACTLVGKVSYFWGGKSYVIGWDDRWGTIRKVTSPGGNTTGTYLPYGLDCSGFVDWVFYNVSDGEYIMGHGGGAQAQHLYCEDISWDEAQPGDLVFYPRDSHVGIVGGWDEDGELLIIHCASGWNNVIITDADGFVSIGRPEFYSEYANASRRGAFCVSP